ncbi:hypothetical protein D7V86_01765 [bacterium D16-51]|nr:hypothetical protein D7V96_01190 [bacterium D16-59]RKI62274.1 hypothetical protein D7V86_01765 [bacterium D16-51]
MIATKDPYIASAYQKLQVISQDKQLYWGNNKLIIDFIPSLWYTIHNKLSISIIMGVMICRLQI